MHGYGVYKWNDGRKYEGYYLNDKKHGLGKYTWADGRIYLGYWSLGKQEGYGKYIQTDKSASIGLWQKGKRIRWLSESEIEICKLDEKFIKIL